MIRLQADCATNTLLSHLIVYANLVSMTGGDIFLDIGLHEPLIIRRIELFLFLKIAGL